MTSTYVGTELDVFANATNWKTYVARHLRTFIRGDVLEVGSGIGSMTQVLCGGARHWTCLEPDPNLSARARSLLGRTATNCEFRVGTLDALRPEESFDAILYMDVVEHIADDGEELNRAASHLRPSGAICVLAPAHPMLYSRFDRAIGHVKRYTKKTLSAAGPPGLRLERLRYLDCCGLLASVGNRFILRSAAPTRGQIVFWDKILVSLSRVLDPLTGYCVGKSVLAVWRKN
jgi:SAM-dependent methyltransferase